MEGGGGAVGEVTKHMTLRGVWFKFQGSGLRVQGWISGFRV